MAKEKCRLLIKTTFYQWVEYECGKNESEQSILARAYHDDDLLANATDTDDFDTEITVEK